MKKIALFCAAAFVFAMSITSCKTSGRCQAYQSKIVKAEKDIAL
jgi:hypothetical protein